MIIISSLQKTETCEIKSKDVYIKVIMNYALHTSEEVLMIFHIYRTFKEGYDFK